MRLYIELFKAKDAWLELSPEQRGAYVQQVGSSMQGVLDAGAELVGLGTTDPGTSHLPASTSSRSGSCPTPRWSGSSRRESSGTGGTTTSSRSMPRASSSISHRWPYGSRSSNPLTLKVGHCGHRSHAGRSALAPGSTDAQRLCANGRGSEEEIPHGG